MHRLTRSDARRIAVSAQLLAAERPHDVVSTVRHLGIVQVDLTAAVAPSADLVMWSRMGRDYRPDDLDSAVESQRLVEVGGFLRPAEDVRLFRAEMAQWREPGPEEDWREQNRRWVEANRACREDILQRLRSEGPLPAADLPDTCAVPWRSSGWSSGRNVTRMLDALERRGEVAVTSRDGGARQWDLADRVYPDTPVVPASEAIAERDRRRLTALGIARARMPEQPGEPLGVGDAGEAAEIEGVKGRWRVDPARLGQRFRGRTALLSPLDRLVMDRRRLAEVFDFDHQLEMYKPAAKRKWGYWALPILHGDRLVGKLDAATDRAAGVLRVNAVHEDVELSSAARAGIDREIGSLADLLGLDVLRA